MVSFNTCQQVGHQEKLFSLWLLWYCLFIYYGGDFYKKGSKSLSGTKHKNYTICNKHIYTEWKKKVLLFCLLTNDIAILAHWELLLIINVHMKFQGWAVSGMYLKTLIYPSTINEHIIILYRENNIFAQ